MSAPDRPAQARGMRCGLGLVLALVAAAAGLAALCVRARLSLRGFGSVNDLDAPIVTTLVVALAGMTVGLLRRASATRSAWALGATCAVLVGLAENEGGRILNFALPALVALTVVLPLAILRVLGPDAASDPRKARRAAVAAGVLDIFLILIAFAVFNFWNEQLVERGYIVRMPESDVRSPFDPQPAEWPSWWPWKPPTKPMPPVAPSAEPPDTMPPKTIAPAEVPRADQDLLKKHFSDGKPLFPPAEPKPAESP